MELRETEALLEKYFDAETSITEENTLKAYFSGTDVAPHLEQYKGMFGYFAQEQQLHFEKVLPLKVKRNYTKWLSVAASVLLFFGMFAWFLNTGQPKELGTYNDPEEAFKETQKALQMLSGKVNIGVNSVNYIGEYEKQRKTIFKD